MTRTPIALANWKMAMTVTESLAFIRDLRAAAADLLHLVEVIICPPFTALWPLNQALGPGDVQLGGQNMAATSDAAQTGAISAALLHDVGCHWVLLGHAEVRQAQGDDDETVNRKVQLALEVGLAPILLVGEGRDEAETQQTALARRLAQLLAGCTPEQVARMVLVYEPEGAIGLAAPAEPAHVAAGVAAIRAWLREHMGDEVAAATRIIYGGSVAPEHANALLASPDLDGLGVGRKGREAAAFAQIVRQIAVAKGL